MRDSLAGAPEVGFFVYVAYRIDCLRILVKYIYICVFQLAGTQII